MIMNMIMIMIIIMLMIIIIIIIVIIIITIIIVIIIIFIIIIIIIDISFVWQNVRLAFLVKTVSLNAPAKMTPSAITWMGNATVDWDTLEPTAKKVRESWL